MRLAQEPRGSASSAVRRTVVALGAALWLSASPAGAQELTLEQATALLDSASVDEVRSGIEAMGLLGSPGAVAPLSARIRRGPPPELPPTDVHPPRLLGRNEAGPVLFELVQHRRPEVRLRAVQAIATCRPDGADRALVVALSDSSAPVRTAAAQTLGELRAVSALDSLFLASDHGGTEAGPAIPQVPPTQGLARVTAVRCPPPLGALRPMLLTLMQRADLPARARLTVVSAVSELATAEARALLEEAANDLPARDPVRRAAEEAAARISS